MQDLNLKARRILETIYNNGGEATTSEIKQNTEIKNLQIVKYHAKEVLAEAGFITYTKIESEEHPTGVLKFELTEEGEKQIAHLFEDGEEIPIKDRMEDLENRFHEVEDVVEDLIGTANFAEDLANDSEVSARKAVEEVKEIREEIEEIKTESTRKIEDARREAQEASQMAKRAREDAREAADMAVEKGELVDRIEAVDGVIEAFRDLNLIEGNVETGLEDGRRLRQLKKNAKPEVMSVIEDLHDSGALEPFRHMDGETAENLAHLAEETDLDHLVSALAEESRIETLRNLDKSGYQFSDITTALAHFGGVATEQEIADYLYADPSVIREMSYTATGDGGSLVIEEDSDGRRIYTYKYTDRIMQHGGVATHTEFSGGAFSIEGGKSRVTNYDGRFGYLSYDFAEVTERDGETLYVLPERCRVHLRPGYDRDILDREEETVEHRGEVAPDGSGGWLSDLV